MSRRLTFAATGISVIALGAIYLVSNGGARAATVNIDVGNYYFCSQASSGGVCETSIAVGDTVTWNVSSGTHHVIECDSTFTTCPPAGGFDSGVLNTGQTFSRIFSTAGVFEYWCSIHTTQMEGRITVAAQATATPTSTAPPTQPASPTAAPTGATPTTTPATAPITGGAPSDGLPVSGAALLTVIGGLLLVSAVVTIRASRRS